MSTVVFGLVALLTLGSIALVSTRYWSKGEWPPAHLLTTFVSLLLVNVINAAFRADNRFKLLLKWIACGLCLVAVYYLLRIYP